MAVKRSGNRGKSVKVRGYRRIRFDKEEHIQRHGRGKRSPTPGGYKTGGQRRKKSKGSRRRG